MVGEQDGRLPYWTKVLLAPRNPEESVQLAEEVGVSAGYRRHTVARSATEFIIFLLCSRATNLSPLAGSRQARCTARGR